MNKIARNPIAIYTSAITSVIKRVIKSTIFLVLLIISDCSLADAQFIVPGTIPEFHQYNRGINFGSEISRDVKYKGMPSDKLVVGVISPDMNNWESHSTVTTSLFSIDTSVKDASVKKNVVFYAKSFGMAKKQSVLWVSVRYFDEHGVFIDSTGGDTFDVPSQWQEISIPLTSTKQESVYAEVWFVKYEDADKTGETIHPVYLSGITVK